MERREDGGRGEKRENVSSMQNSALKAHRTEHKQNAIEIENCIRHVPAREERVHRLQFFIPFLGYTHPTLVLVVVVGGGMEQRLW